MISYIQCIFPIESFHAHEKHSTMDLWSQPYQGDAVCNEVHPGRVPGNGRILATEKGEDMWDFNSGDLTNRRMKSPISLEDKMGMGGYIRFSHMKLVNEHLEIALNSNHFGATSRVPGSWPMPKIIIKCYRSSLWGMAWDICFCPSPDGCWRML